MAWTPISGTPPQYSDANNDLAGDYYLKFYAAGTTTQFSCAVDSTGTQTLAKVKINSSGYPISNPLDDTTIFIPYVDQAYRIVLYKSEADADADNTINAAFNIDGLTPDAVSADTKDSSEVTMRDVTLKVQDDYDRSPLFIDGTDFTAGAGPHVITVPSGWVPSNADTRFYLLSVAGVVLELTPSSKDLTTFTVEETLLSTDIIFIGDDQFRDQMDGDPENIKAKLSLSNALLASNDLSDVQDPATARTNLDVYSKSESQAAPATISGFTATTAYYLDENGDSQGDNILDHTGSLVTSWKTVGPTGSGASMIWSALDNLPLSAKFVDINVITDTASNSRCYVATRLNGSGITSPNTISFASQVDLVSASYYTIESSGTIKAALDSNNIMSVITYGGGSPASTFRFKLVGFGV